MLIEDLYTVALGKDTKLITVFPRNLYTANACLYENIVVSSTPIEIFKSSYFIN
jgi:hypothetical protein